MRPYSAKLQEILQNVSSGLDASEGGAYAAQREVKNVLLVVVTQIRIMRRQCQRYQTCFVIGPYRIQKFNCFCTLCWKKSERLFQENRLSYCRNRPSEKIA